MDGKGLFILYEAVIMVTLAIAYGIWCATSDKWDKGDKWDKSEKSEKRELKVYTYYKKDFDDMWETINSWCVKYCNKEFLRYHDEIFLDKSEIEYEPGCEDYSFSELFLSQVSLKKIKYNYDRYKAACKYPKLWKFLNDVGYFNDLDVITILWMMEDLVRFSFWRTPNENDFLDDQDCDFFVTTEDVRVLEKRFGVDGNVQYKIKDIYLGE